MPAIHFMLILQVYAQKKDKMMNLKVLNFIYNVKNNFTTKLQV